MLRNRSRFLRVLADSAHCHHCKGKAGGPCACSECPRQPQSRCASSSSSDTLRSVFSAILSRLADSDDSDEDASDHCDHCKGLEGACACKRGCPSRTDSKCIVTHKVSCDGSGSDSIRGPRYICAKCFIYDLCRKCYVGDKHIGSHPFKRMDRVGLKPILLELRDKSAQGTPGGNHCSHCKGLNGVCACKNGCSTRSGSKCRVVHNNIVCDGCKSDEIQGKRRFKCAECSNYDICSSCYDEGKHSMHSFKVYDRVGSTPTFRAPRHKPAPSNTATPARQSSGSWVKLVGLKHTDMNGLCGSVTDPCEVPGRAEVAMDGTKERHRIKFENLSIEADILD